MSPQLSCGDTCQIWMWFRESNRYFCKIENFAYGEISERGFSNPHPWPNTKPELWCHIWIECSWPIHAYGSTKWIFIAEYHGLSSMSMLHYIEPILIFNGKIPWIVDVDILTLSLITLDSPLICFGKEETNMLMIRTTYHIPSQSTHGQIPPAWSFLRIITIANSSDRLTNPVDWFISNGIVKYTTSISKYDPGRCQQMREEIVCVTSSVIGLDLS